jgi:hemolysin D
MSVQPTDFLPGLLAIERRAPHPIARKILYTLMALFAAVVLWIVFGTLDIVAVAEGKLVPSTYVKIVQPADAGIVKDILVHEGQRVKEGQTLARMDTVLSEADRRSAQTEYEIKQLALRRIDAQLANAAFDRNGEDSGLFAQSQAQFVANRTAYENQLAQERATLDKARYDLAAAEQIKTKLEQTLPHYRNQEAAYEKLGKDGYAGSIMVNDKTRERIEKEQDLKAQLATISAAKATILNSEQRLRQVTADYHRQLQAERAEVASAYERLKQEVAKQEHRHGLLELKAPQDGVVKDLATHTPGTVVQPGTILMTLVPAGEKLKAEVWVSNEDVGFVHEKQDAKIKLSAYPFQKYGMLTGEVIHVSADAQDPQQSNAQERAALSTDQRGMRYRTIVDLDKQLLVANDESLELTPGMQVVAEISLGDRTVLEYLLSPVQKAFTEAGRER